MRLKKFMKVYLCKATNINDYTGSLRSLRVAKTSPYFWSLIQGPGGGLTVLSGDHKKDKGFISYVSSTIPSREV